MSDAGQEPRGIPAAFENVPGDAPPGGGEARP